MDCSQTDRSNQKAIQEQPSYTNLLIAISAGFAGLASRFADFRPAIDSMIGNATRSELEHMAAAVTGTIIVCRGMRDDRGLTWRYAAGVYATMQVGWEVLQQKAPWPPGHTTLQVDQLISDGIGLAIAGYLVYQRPFDAHLERAMEHLLGPIRGHFRDPYSKSVNPLGIDHRRE